MKQSPAKRLSNLREKLYSRFEKGREPSLLTKNASLIDDYFRDAFEESRAGEKLSISGHYFALVAQGGYGRREQCVHSDVDILFLFDKNIPALAEELIQEIIYPLWDIKIQVGYATRTIEDCLNLSIDNLEVFTALLDSRFICGRTPLYNSLSQKLTAKFQGVESQKSLKNLIESFRDRHKAFGDSAYLLEPNLKNGLGGLRDYHGLLWLYKIHRGIEGKKDLEFKGHIPGYEFQAMQKSLELIWKTRNHLHILTKRKCDQLHFEYQETIASRLNYIEKNGQKPVERFIGDLHGGMEIIKHIHLMLTGDIWNKCKLSNKKVVFKKSGTAGVEISSHMLRFDLSNSRKITAGLIMDIFLESTRLKFAISNEAKRLIKKHSKKKLKINKHKKIIQQFEKLLVSLSYEFNSLDDMLSTGFLITLIPEFENIINRIQYNQYHIYPVDKHSLHLIKTIKALTQKKSDKFNETYAKIYSDINNKTTLYWAALLHDIGKGTDSDDHSEAGAEITEKILLRFGMNKRKIDDITFIIKNHLFLANTARRRDIDDEETAVFCARKIKTVDRLRMLYVVTVADSKSTGPNAWNKWIEDLLRDLFQKTLGIMENKELATNKAEREIYSKRVDTLSICDESEIDKSIVQDFFDNMPPRYLINTKAVDIYEHIKMNYNFTGKGCRTHSVKDPNTGRTKFSVFTNDKIGLFAKIAGVFTLNEFNIFNAQTYSWDKNKALATFIVKPMVGKIKETERLKKIKNDLNRVIDKTFNPADHLEIAKTEAGSQDAPFRVEIDNKYSKFFTIIEVYSYDFPGLLFVLTDALTKCGLDIRYSKTATHVDQMLDIFYVRNEYGEKIFFENEIIKIKENIEKKLHNIYF